MNPPTSVSGTASVFSVPISASASLPSYAYSGSSPITDLGAVTINGNTFSPSATASSASSILLYGFLAFGVIIVLRILG